MDSLLSVLGFGTGILSSFSKASHLTPLSAPAPAQHNSTCYQKPQFCFFMLSFNVEMILLTFQTFFFLKKYYLKVICFSILSLKTIFLTDA